MSEGEEVPVPLPLDDLEAELPEGYLLVLSVQSDHVHPLDEERIRFLNRFILVAIEDDDGEYICWCVALNDEVFSLAPLVCNSSVLVDTVLINCAGRDGLPLPPITPLQCSIDDEPPFNCKAILS